MTQKKHLTRPIAALFAVLAVLVCLFPAQAMAVTQEEIDEIQRQKEALTALRVESQNKVDELEAQQASVLEQKAALDERNQYAIEQLQLISEQIELYSQMIDDKSAEVDAARQQELEQLERYRTRVRAMEENGSYGILSLVLQTSNLGEFLTVMDDIGEIMESDKKLQLEYVEARENTETVLAEYEQVKTELEGKQAELKNEQAELEGQIEEAFSLIAELQNDIDKAREEYEINMAAEDEMVAYFDELSAQLAREQEAARLAAEQAAQQAQNNGNSGGGTSQSGGSVSGTGSFTWPVPSCTIITSRYGSRFHPILQTERFHAGIDIGAASGSTIVAADGGTVAVAEYNDSYGNYVFIDHGNGYSTVYAHMSSMAVSAGQSVSQGDTIGYVGSTGWSTGPHCHFEIRSGGSTTDPAAYFSGLTYWNC